MTQPSPEALMPCPFCGSQPEMNNHETFTSIRCNKCCFSNNASVGNSRKDRDQHKERSILTEWWNTRPSPTVPEGILQAMDEAVKNELASLNHEYICKIMAHEDGMCDMTPFRIIQQAALSAAAHLGFELRKVDRA